MAGAAEIKDSGARRRTRAAVLGVLKGLGQVEVHEHCTCSASFGYGFGIGPARDPCHDVNMNIPGRPCQKNLTVFGRSQVAWRRSL
jgi:hypothetical protein